MRAAAYFILWMGIAFFLSSWSRRQDQGGNGRLLWKLRNLSAAGAVVYGVTMHFAMVDWAMSLLPAFHSTIWGPLFALGQLLSALSFSLIVFARERKHPPLAEVLSPKAVNDMGSLLLTFLIAWAYMAWFQFMLIWIANLPVDIIYYLPRTSTGWLCVMWAIFLLHFAVPFFLLLMHPVKRSPVMLAAIGGLILFMQLAYMYYQITPAFHGAPRRALDGFLHADRTGRNLAVLLLVAVPALAAARCAGRAAAQALHLRRLDEEEAAREEAIAYE